MADGGPMERPLSPMSPTEPNRIYHSSMSGRAVDDRAPPVELHHYPEPGNVRGNAGLRRRPSGNVPNHQRSQSHGEYDMDRPSIQSEESRRRLRALDDDFLRDQDPRGYYPRRDDYRTNPESMDRSKPPRAYRNNETYDRMPSSASKPVFDESRLDYHGEKDLEKGRQDWSPERQERPRYQAYAESIDGYNYEGNNRKSKLDFKSLSPQEKAEVLRLPWTQWMNSDVKNHFVASIGEFVGTTMFLFFAFAGTQVANIESAAATDTTDSNTTTGGSTGFNVTVYLYIAVIFGFSLMVNVWVFFRISGGLFNPAVTLGMVLVGAIPPVRAICLFVAQILGSIAASGMVLGMFPTPLNVRTTLSAETSIVQGVFIEAILTAELVFTIFMLAKEKHKATFIAPVGIGLALFIAELVGVYYTGGSLNPARSFGPCVVTAIFDKEHWIYWVGPIMGALIAVFFYKFIKMLEYEMANPGQDGDEMNDPTKNPDKRAQITEERRLHR